MGLVTHIETQLRADLQQAFDNYMGGVTSGPWEGLVAEFAEAIQEGGLSASRAARIDLLLQRTRGGQYPSSCPTCRCPIPDQQHPGLDWCSDETSRYTS